MATGDVRYEYINFEIDVEPVPNIPTNRASPNRNKATFDTLA